MENETTNVTNTETPATKTNPVVGALWVNRNPFQKTMNLGVLLGFSAGVLGTSATLVGASALALTGYYGWTNKVTGVGKKIGLTTLAFFASCAALGLGGTIGSELSGKEFAPDSKVNPTVVAPATPTATAPSFAPVARKWNDAANKAELEESIRTGFTLQLTGAEQSIASVKCEATAAENIWSCDIRKLGDVEAVPYRIEYANGTWAGQPY